MQSDAMVTAGVRASDELTAASVWAYEEARPSPL